MSGEDRNKALEAVKLTKEKRCGNIKGITCENVSEYKSYLKEDESVYSPTCSTESLMSTPLIDNMEQRDAAVFNVAGDYLQTEMSSDKRIFLRIRDEFVDILCELNNDYKPYVQYENVKKVL